MTTFELQVAKALQRIFYEWRENPPPEEKRGFGEYAAPRVAAAIRDGHCPIHHSLCMGAEAAALAVLRGSPETYDQRRQAWLDAPREKPWRCSTAAALAALRGEP